jgi:hypothetical protein
MIRVSKNVAKDAAGKARKRVAGKKAKPAPADPLAGREVLVPVMVRVLVPAEIVDDIDAAQAAVEWLMESGIKVDGAPVAFDLITPQVR